jgi:hypothetical protein
LVRGEEGTFFYYLALLIGMVLWGSYLWTIINTTVFPTEFLFLWILVFSGVLLAVSAFGFAATTTRSGRVGLTMIAGILGGIHGYLIFVMYDLIQGIVLFAWMAFGLLISFAAFNWLYE